VLAVLPTSSALASERLEPGPRVAPGVFLAKAPKAGKATTRSARRAKGPVGSRKRPRVQSRIVGGNATTIGEWPWQAAITLNPEIYSGNAFQRQFCGGTLVTLSIVVTAGHCVYDFQNGEFFPVSDHASVTGRTTLTDTSEGQEILWSNYFVFVDGAGNPLFDPATLDWDVVFAQLASPSPSSNSAPVMIAGSDEAASWGPADENAWATGWGSTMPGGSTVNELREVNIDMIADSTCGSAPFHGSDFFPETMVCAGEVAGGQDTCQGDSGGPLVAELGAEFRLVGDTSWGFGCAAPSKPGVYGRVAEHPICTALQNGVQSVAGVNVVGGSGACLNVGTPAGSVPVGDLGGPGPGPGSPGAGPETTITKGPKNKTKKKTVEFQFISSVPGSSFACAVDGQALKVPCTSPFKVKVRNGRHTFQVRATDPSGNADPTPASDSWKRKKKKKR
jgi:Trypsin